VVTIDFITKLLKKVKQHDSIMVEVEILTKETHKATNITKIYMNEFSRFHGVPKEIVLDRDSKFTLKLWQGFFKGFGRNLNLSTSYHPESDGKIKRTNRIVEYMLIMYLMDQPSKWKDC
jgi:hypothetical protein